MSFYIHMYMFEPRNLTYWVYIRHQLFHLCESLELQGIWCGVSADKGDPVGRLPEGQFGLAQLGMALTLQRQDVSRMMGFC